MAPAPPSAPTLPADGFEYPAEDEPVGRSRNTVGRGYAGPGFVSSLGLKYPQPELPPDDDPDEPPKEGFEYPEDGDDDPPYVVGELEDLPEGRLGFEYPEEPPPEYPDDGREGLLYPLDEFPPNMPPPLLFQVSRVELE